VVRSLRDESCMRSLRGDDLSDDGISMGSFRGGATPCESSGILIVRLRFSE
jgi:hypothetical protein